MREKSNKYIWIEAEEWENAEWDIEDENSDVKVTFSNRTVWMAKGAE